MPWAWRDFFLLQRPCHIIVIVIILHILQKNCYFYRNIPKSQATFIWDGSHETAQSFMKNIEIF